MPRGRYFSRTVVFILLCFAEAAFSQSSEPPAQSPQSSSGTSPSAVATFQSSTRMVTLEVVVKDRQGHHVGGLAAGDFQVFEQSPSRGKEKHPQKIAAFREVEVADLPSPDIGEVTATDGIFTNAVVPTAEPVPPTILLLDGLNTEVKYQAQVHVQMVKMLKSLPKNVPVAVFLFGHRLRMLQDFTTDPSLLQAALQKAGTTAGEGVARLDPRDDPNAMSLVLEKLNQSAGGGTNENAPPTKGPNVPTSGTLIDQSLIDAVKRFEQETYASTMDMRVEHTIEALASLGRHIAGYPGRKNLMWISTSFPIYLSPLMDSSGKPITEFTGLNNTGIRNYWPKVKVLAGVLSDAQVAVYPINPAGVQVSALFEADTRVRDNSGKAVGDTLQRETMMRANEQDTMQVLAEETGGKVCAGSNDLSECIRKAVDDSSSFYEISYYPDSPNWDGEYRTVSIKTRQPGLHLAYRAGYYAGLEASKSAKEQTDELREAACDDYLDASSILLTVQSIAPDSPEKLKFYLTMKSSDLTLRRASDGTEDLDITVAACTFDKNGWPIQFMTDAVRRRFDAKESQSLAALGGLPHVVSVPGPKPASVRLLVRDEKSGRMGSLHMNVDDLVAIPMSKAGVNVQPEVAQ